LHDNTQSDVNEMYLKFGAVPTRQSFDYRFTSANSADQTIFIPHAAIGSWYVLVYANNVPAPSTFSLSANGYLLKVTGITPSSIGNSAPVTMAINGGGFEPGVSVWLTGPG